MPYLFCARKKNFDLGLFISKEHFVDMELITENWRVFRDEAFSLVEQAQIKKLRKIMTLALTPFSNMAGKGFI